MKNIYRIKLFLITLLVFSSCAVDNDDPITNYDSTTIVQLDKTGTITTQGTTGETVSISLSQTLDSDTKVEYI